MLNVLVAALVTSYYYVPAVANVWESIGEFSGLIEEVGCSVILCVNKWDTQRNKKGVTKDSAVEEIRYKFAHLKYAPILFTSAKEGSGFQDLAARDFHGLNDQMTCQGLGRCGSGSEQRNDDECEGGFHAAVVF